MPGLFSSTSRAPLCAFPVRPGNLPAGLSRRGAFAVLVRSSNSNLNWIRSLRFLRGPKLPADSHSARQRFLIATRRGIPCSHAAPVRPGTGESVSWAPPLAPFPVFLAGSQAHQLHPAFLRFDPELSRGFPPDVRRSRGLVPSVHPCSVKEQHQLPTTRGDRQEISLHKLLMVNS